MATNKVAMGMVVLKGMKEGTVSTVGLGNRKQAINGIIKKKIWNMCECLMLTHICKSFLIIDSDNV